MGIHGDSKDKDFSTCFGMENPHYVADLWEDKRSPDSGNSDPNAPKKVYEPGEERRMLRNVILISFSFTLLFTAFNSMSSLQSSINPDGLGNYSNSTIYAAIVVSCFFLPTFLISKFTVKWTLVFSVFGYCLYMAAQFKPMYETLIPASIILGLCAAPLWSAKCTYLTHVGHQCSGILGDKSSLVIGRFFGIFFLAFQSTQVWGNLISSVLLAGEHDKEKNITVCGATFCPSDIALGNIREVPDSARYMISAVFLGFSLAAAGLMAASVDPLLRYGEKEREGESSKLTGIGLFMATGKQMLKPYQVLLIPITIWCGLEQGFFVSDYTQAYISCAWDVGQVGYILICYGACDAISSISFDPVIRKIGRTPVFIFGSLVNGGVLMTLFHWKPDPETPIIFFVLAALWGIGDAIWQTQINVLYGVLFSHNEEPAFSNYRLWESLGFVIAFLSGSNLCVDKKIYSLAGVLALGMAGYLMIEFLEWKKNKSDKQ